MWQRIMGYKASRPIHFLVDSTCIRTLVGHANGVNSIRLNSENNTFVSCSDDKTIKIWNWRTGQCLNTIDVPNSSNINNLILILIFVC